MFRVASGICCGWHSRPRQVRAVAPDRRRSLIPLSPLRRRRLLCHTARSCEPQLSA
jgi:hypothetical protein